jgi:site-specific recombinase
MTAEAAPAAHAQFERRYGINGPARRLSRALYGLLLAAGEPAPLSEQVRRLAALFGWVLEGATELELYGAEGAPDGRSARLAFLLAVLEREPALALPLRDRLHGVLAQASVVRLLCSSGLPSEAGFFGELRTRLAASFLPQPPDEGDLSRPFSELFGDEASVEWLRTLPASRVSRLGTALLGEAARGALRVQRRRALAVVSTRVAALGLAEDVVARAGEDPQGPFLRLASSFSEDPATDVSAEERARCLAECRANCRRVFAHLEAFGVSTDLVYRLECIQHGLDRLEALEKEASGEAGDAAHPATRLLATVLVDARRARSVRALVRSSSRQLARKIVERAGDTGDHYITSTRKQWVKMLASAGGGGVLTAGTTFLKFLVGWMTLPLFFEGGFHSMNFAFSFLLMQVLGLTLATKQPSMTAAAIAAALGRERGAAQKHEAVVELVARVSRSQLAAVLGNLGMVIPTCLLADFLHRQLTGRTFLDAFAGGYVVNSLHPTRSGTIFFAALTGVLLWLSSVAAGWLDNWVAYRRLPEAVAESSRVRALVGASLAGRLGRLIGRWASPFAGCMSLGLLLGTVPLLSRIFGLPLDVRHVTLSTGGLTLAFGGLGWEGFVAAGGLGAVVGIAVIGLLNFGVSFACALVVAVRAREVPWREDLRLGGELLRALFTRPGRFFFPPGDPVPQPAPPPTLSAPPGS